MTKFDLSKLPAVPDTVEPSNNLDLTKLPEADILSRDVYSTPMSNFFSPSKGDLSEYKNYFKSNIIPVHHGYDALNEARARNQTGGQLAKGMADQIVIGTLIGATVEGFGSLMNIPTTLFKLATGTRDDFDQNVIQNLGQSIMESSRNRSPIHMTKKAEEGFALGDRTWWAANTPSIFTALSMMIPARAASLITMKLGGILANGIRLKKAFDATKSIEKANLLVKMASSNKVKHGLDVFTSAMYGRHIDSSMESSQLYNDEYEKLLGLGYDNNKAHKIASKAANLAYNFSFAANLGLDVLQWSIMLRHVAAANRAINANVAAALGKAEYKGMSMLGSKGAENLAKLGRGKTTSKFSIGKDILAEGALEGLEEFNVGLGIAFGEKHAEILRGVSEDTKWYNDWSKTFASHLGDRTTWDEMFFGAIGGMVFGTVGKWGLIQSSKNNQKESDNAVRSLMNELNYIAEENKKIMQDFENGLVVDADFKQLNLERQLLVKGLFQGNLGITIEMLDNIASMTSEQLEQWGLPGDSAGKFSGMANSLKQAAEVYNSVSDLNFGHGVYDTYLHVELASNRYEATRVGEIIEQYQEDSKDNRFENLPSFVTEEVTKWVETREALGNAKKALINIEASKRASNEVIERTKDKIRELEDSKRDITDRDERSRINTRITALHNTINTLSDGIDRAESSKDNYTRLISEFETIIDGYEEAIKLNENESDIRKWADKAIEEGISNIANNKLVKANQIKGLKLILENTNKEYDKLRSDTAYQNEFIEKRKAQDEQRNNKRFQEFKEDIDSITKDGDYTTWLATLEKINEDYGGEYLDEYNKAKAKLEKLIETNTKKNEFTKSYTDIIDHLYNDKTVDELSDTQKEFYDKYKDAIDKRVEAKREADRLAKEQAIIDEQQAATNAQKAKENAINKILDSDATKLFSKENPGYNKDLLKYQLELFLNDSLTDINLYSTLTDVTIEDYMYGIRAISTILNNNTTLINNLITNINLILSDALGTNVTMQSVLESVDVLNKSDRINDDNRDIVANDIFGIIVMISNKIDDSLHTPENADKTERLLEDIDNILNEDSDPDVKKSEDVNRAIAANTRELTKSTRLLNSIIALVINEYGVNNSKTINIQSIFDIYLKYNKKESLIQNWAKIRDVFKALAITHPNSYKVLDTNITIDFGMNSDVNGTDYIDKYIRDKTTYIAPIPYNQGMYVYLHHLKDLEANKNLTDEQVEVIAKYNTLVKGDKLYFKLQPDHEYTSGHGKYKSKEERNANHMTVPIAIMHNDVAIGFVHELPYVHSGINYTNESGEYNPFTSLINNDTLDLMMLHQKDLKRFYKGEIGLDALDGKLMVELSRLAHVNTNNKGVITNPKTIKHLLDYLFYNNRNKDESLSLQEIKSRYKSHEARFRIDHNETANIRNTLLNNGNIRLNITRKTSTIIFDGPSNNVVSDRIAPITVDGETRLFILHNDVRETDKKKLELVDLMTGKPFEHHIEYPTGVRYKDDGTIRNEAYALHLRGMDNGKPVYQLTYLERGTLRRTKTNEDGTKVNDDSIAKYILKKLQALHVMHLAVKNGSKTKAEVNAVRNLLSEELSAIVEYNTEKQKAQLGARPGSSLFNFMLNKFDDDTTIEFNTVEGYGDSARTVRHIIKKKYNPATRSYDIKHSSGTPNAKGQLDQTNPKTITEEQAYDLLAKVRRANKFVPNSTKLDIETKYTDPVTNIEYDNYYDYIMKSGALLTNVHAMLDKEGKPVSNNIVRSGGNNVGGIHGKVESYEATDTDAITNKPVEPIVDTFDTNEVLGKKLDDVVLVLEDATIDFFNDIIKKLGINITIDSKLLPGTDNAEWNGKTNTIQFGERLNNAISKRAFITYTLQHEMIHAILDNAESRMTNEQRDNYRSKLVDYLDSLERYVHNDDNTLDYIDKQRLRNYINISKRNINKDNPNYQEVVAYAFGDQYIPRILTSISNGSKVTDGFWSKLFDIISYAFSVISGNIDGTKLSELVNIMNDVVSNTIMFNQDVNIDTTTDTTTDTKVADTKQEVKRDTKSRFTIPRIKIDLSSKSKKKSEDINAEQFYNQNMDKISNRYGINNKDLFVQYYNELSDNQRNELYCL